ncbi:MAG: hypothetical protein A2V21_300915 [Deltaproteobacteria bacterium GWC2_55_46]|nr:MAG: hypothetical protein A2Z79_10290 [Deltaproteobacteria bacterium GWA2_55_82]OGQ62978.1 MAG: hypothetical protein A3I81_06675 [Deltaproteobacteria bacterium RIFCSPLOWO2_02_FULL_55_12]OIJ72941.1 MAG: hypothetical protein A2V21_300915 [Deltaproteobacteria bacterium GWC2_55_46]
MGVGALAAGAIKCVKQWRPDADIAILDYAKRGEFYNLVVNGRDILVKLVNIRFSKKLFLPNNIALLIVLAAAARVIPFRRLRAKLIAGNSTLMELDSADVAASIAGGDSFSDIYGFGRFFYVCLPQILVILMGKPLVQLPQTFGPFKMGVTKAVAKFILQNSFAAYSRDRDGLTDVRALIGLRGDSEKVRFCFDMGFVVDPVKPERISVEGTELDGAEQATCTVGLNVSGLLYIGGYSMNNMFGLKVDYKRLIGEIIDFLIMKKRANIILIPHVFGGHRESDSEACATVYEELKASYGGRLSLLSGEYDQGEIKHMIGKCGFFIGSRMHACIAALSQGVPAVPIAYSRKFIGVMESIGVEGYVADPCTLDSDGVLRVVDKAFEERAEIAKKLKGEMPYVKETVLNLFESMGLGRG